MEGHFTQMSNESRDLLSGDVGFFTLPNSRNEEPFASDKSEQGTLDCKVERIAQRDKTNLNHGLLQKYAKMKIFP
jgi:hypothetical protein